MSKFEYSGFSGGDGDFAVNAEKYTEEQAIKIFQEETSGVVGEARGEYKIVPAYVRHRAGVNEDGERQVGWWLEYHKYKRSCPVWSFERRWK